MAHYQRPRTTQRAHRLFEDSYNTEVFSAVTTRYPCDERDVRSLQDENALMSRCPKQRSVREAAYRLQDFHESQAGSDARIARQRSALHRLELLEGLDVNDDWSTDVIYKVFHDLDDALTGGQLRGNVTLVWGADNNFPPPINDMLACTGATDDFGSQSGGRVTIAMNAVLLLLNPANTLRDLIGVLIHEMVHAYLWICCLDTSGRDEGDSIDQEHGRRFLQCCRAINRTLRRYTCFRVSVEPSDNQTEWVNACIGSR